LLRGYAERLSRQDLLAQHHDRVGALADRQRAELTGPRAHRGRWEHGEQGRGQDRGPSHALRSRCLLLSATADLGAKDRWRAAGCLRPEKATLHPLRALGLAAVADADEHAGAGEPPGRVDWDADGAVGWHGVCGWPRAHQAVGEEREWVGLRSRGGPGGAGPWRGTGAKR